jgi:hypothetical protein
VPRPAFGTRSPRTHRQAHAVKNICGDALARENSTLTRNADGMRVCAMSHHTTLRKNRTRCSPTIRVFAGALVRVNTHSPLAKNFAQKAVCGRVAGLTRTKNARIGADRFAFRVRAWRPSAVCRGVFRVRFGIVRRSAAPSRRARRRALGSASDPLLQQIADRLRVGFAT